MGDITGDFIGNRAVSTNTSLNINNNFATGGAIFNDDYGTIGNIKGDFIRNNVTSTLGIAGGGAINNNSGAVINSITGNFHTDRKYCNTVKCLWLRGCYFQLFRQRYHSGWIYWIHFRQFH